MAHSKYINVPCTLLREVQGSRIQQSLLALSVAIKCWSPSSVYLMRSRKQMRRDFHLGKQKVDKLLSALPQSPLFSLQTKSDGTLCITARCFRQDYAHWVRYGNHPASLAMHAVKVRCREKGEIRLSEIHEELTQLLTLMIVNAKNRQDEFHTKHPGVGGSSHAQRFLSVPGLAAVTGCSPRTVIRRTQRLVREHHLAVMSHPLVRVCDNIYHASAEWASTLIRIGALGFRRQVNDYTVLQWEMRRRFQYILFGHRKRIHSRATHHHVLSQSELHEMYD